MSDEDEKPSRLSTVVQLTLLGVVAAPLVAQAVAPFIPAGKTVHRNLYRDRESCERDYSPAQCQPSGGGGSGSGGGGGYSRWRGPEYYENRSLPEAVKDPGPGRMHLANGVETSTRGGFGRAGGFLRAAG